MKVQSLQYEPVVSDAELHRFVADAVARRSNGLRRLIAVQRRLSDYRSSFAIEEVTACFDDGTQAPLIFKNLSPECLLGDAREVRPAFGYDPAREVVVYRDLLSRLPLGTAYCYAAVTDAAAGRYWLLLEKVSGTDLARAGDFAHWMAAARWLAAAHQRLTAVVEQGGTTEELMRYDSRCFRRWIDRAEQVMQKAQIAEGRAVAEWEIAWLLQRCRLAVRLVDALPSAVIHGEFYPSNVLIGKQDDAVRICAIDWETAGWGPALLDVAALITGGWAEEEKEQLTAAYVAVAAEGPRAPMGRGDSMTALRCCRLLLAVKWIGWSPHWQPPPEHRYDWLAESLELARMLNAELQQYG